MAGIVYYSNFCEPSKQLLQLLSRTKLKNEVHFLCIDKRTKGPKGEIILEVEGQRLLLPPSVTRVPALFVIGTKQTLFEDDIYAYLSPQEQKINHEATQGMGEPEHFSSQFNSMSDSYSFWDQGSEELGTKGNGGMRQQHNYVAVDGMFSIPTPPEDYEPDKIGKKGSKTVDQLKAEREMTVPNPIARS
jgi:hypothetical protein